MKREIENSVRKWIMFFMISLVLSGLTAFPLQMELEWLSTHIGDTSAMGSWIHRVTSALLIIGDQFPFLSYGTDWLAFAHIVIAIGFIGPYLDPVRNKWVILQGLIACVLIVPVAFIAGAIRGIPFFWQLIDCSFGILGFWPLKHVYNLINELEYLSQIQPLKSSSHEKK